MNCILPCICAICYAVKPYILYVSFWYYYKNIIKTVYTVIKQLLIFMYLREFVSAYDLLWDLYGSCRY